MPRPEKPRTAGRFEKNRRDHARETAEDYAELILRQESAGLPARPTDLARLLGVSHVTVLRTLERLTRGGLLERAAGCGVVLTPRGRRLAQAAHDRHQLVVTFLARLGVPPEVAEADAEGIEHHLSPVTLERWAAFCAAPAEDRIGTPIEGRSGQL